MASRNRLDDTRQRPEKLKQLMNNKRNKMENNNNPFRPFYIPKTKRNSGYYESSSEGIHDNLGMAPLYNYYVKFNGKTFVFHSKFMSLPASIFAQMVYETLGIPNFDLQPTFGPLVHPDSTVGCDVTYTIFIDGRGGMFEDDGEFAEPEPILDWSEEVSPEERAARFANAVSSEEIAAAFAEAEKPAPPQQARPKKIFVPKQINKDNGLVVSQEVGHYRRQDNRARVRRKNEIPRPPSNNNSPRMGNTVSLSSREPFIPRLPRDDEGKIDYTPLDQHFADLCLQVPRQQKVLSYDEATMGFEHFPSKSKMTNYKNYLMICAEPTTISRIDIAFLHKNKIKNARLISALHSLRSLKRTHDENVGRSEINNLFDLVVHQKSIKKTPISKQIVVSSPSPAPAKNEFSTPRSKNFKSGLPKKHEPLSKEEKVKKKKERKAKKHRPNNQPKLDLPQLTDSAKSQNYKDDLVDAAKVSCEDSLEGRFFDPIKPESPPVPDSDNVVALVEQEQEEEGEDKKKLSFLNVSDIAGRYYNFKLGKACSSYFETFSSWLRSLSKLSVLGGLFKLATAAYQPLLGSKFSFPLSTVGFFFAAGVVYSIAFYLQKGNYFWYDKFKYTLKAPVRVDIVGDERPFIDAPHDIVRGQTLIEFEEEKISGIAIGLFRTEIDLPLFKFKRDSCADLELVTQMTTARIVSITQNPLALLERLSRNTHAGSCISYDRAQILHCDVMNESARLGAAICLHHQNNALLSDPYSHFRSGETVRLLPLSNSLNTLDLIITPINYLYYQYNHTKLVCILAGLCMVIVMMKSSYLFSRVLTTLCLRTISPITRTIVEDVLPWFLPFSDCVIIRALYHLAPTQLTPTISLVLFQNAWLMTRLAPAQNYVNALGGLCVDFVARILHR